MGLSLLYVAQFSRFGDEKTRDVSVFSFNGGEPCKGFEEVLKKYNEIAQKIDLAGPTSFAPAIKGIHQLSFLIQKKRPLKLSRKTSLTIFL